MKNTSMKNTSMKSASVHDEPSTVSAEHGVVIMDGPGPVALTLTPEAAELTGRRLRTAAAAALLQALDPDLPERPTDDQQ